MDGKKASPHSKHEKNCWLGRVNHISQGPPLVLEKKKKKTQPL